MVTAGEHFDTAEIFSYLEELAAVQDEVLKLLAEKREAIASSQLDRLRQLNEQEEVVQQKMTAMHDRRATILANAGNDGLACENLEELVESVANQSPTDETADLTAEVREAKQRMRLLQHEALTNWVVEQTSLLHVSRLLEIIACGGRLQPTYGKGGSSSRRGTLVDREV